jgi:hypothetical protein
VWRYGCEKPQKQVFEHGKCGAWLRWIPIDWCLRRWRPKYVAWYLIYSLWAFDFFSSSVLAYPRDVLDGPRDDASNATRWDVRWWSSRRCGICLVSGRASGRIVGKILLLPHIHIISPWSYRWKFLKICSCPIDSNLPLSGSVTRQTVCVKLAFSNRKANSCESLAGCGHKVWWACCSIRQERYIDKLTPSGNLP